MSVVYTEKERAVIELANKTHEKWHKANEQALLKERVFLRYWMYAERPSCIAKRFGVSRSTVYRWTRVHPLMRGFLG